MNRKKRKILLLFYEPYKSGITRHILYILRLFQGEDIEFRVLVSSDDNRIPKALKKLLPHDQLTIVPRSRFFSITGLLTARKIISEHGIEQIHIHNLQSALWGYASTFFTTCSTIIFTPHVDTVNGDSTAGWISRFFKIISPFTTFFIAVSISQKRHFNFRKIAPEKKLKCILNHIDGEEISTAIHSPPSTTTDLTLPPATVLLLQVGRLDRQKNPSFLLRVIEKVVKREKKCHFLLLGDGPLRTTIQEQIEEYQLSRHISLHAYRQDIFHLLDKVDIVTSTSLWEGLPYSLLEAAFLKKPIVATDIPGHTDLITDKQSGFLASTEQEFADKLCLLIQSGKLRAEMGENCYKKNRNLFELKNMKAPLSTLYGGS